MCDAVLQRYALALNESDLAPGPLFFSGPDCTGDMYPQQDGDFVGDDFATSVDHPLPTPPRSVVLPFTYHQVELRSESIYGTSGNEPMLSRLFGPAVFRDLREQPWQVKPAGAGGDQVMYRFGVAGENPVGIAVDTFRVVDKDGVWADPADAAAVANRMCRSLQPQALGWALQHLTRWTAGTPRCDEYMRQYCLFHPGEGVCACFEDQAEVTERGEELGVELPVTCFGSRCADSRNQAYKTGPMAVQPCSVTRCQEAAVTAHATLWCAGQLFDPQGQVVAQDAPDVVEPPADEGVAQDSTVAVVTVFAVSGALLLALVGVLFYRRPRVPETKQ